MKRLTIFGGSGFIGQHLLKRLVDEGNEVTVAVRSNQSFKRLETLPVKTIVVDHLKEKDLAACLDGCDSVINLIGILHEASASTFIKVHEELPTRILRQCQIAHVVQYVHMSALPASALVSSRYLSSRGRGEDVVHKEKTDVAVTSLRPSVVFGSGDHFFFSFARLLKWMPLLPLACPNSKFAPVFVDDVVMAISRVVEDPQLFSGQRLDLVGPAVYTLRELIDFLINASDRRCLVLNLPNWAARLQGLVLGQLPGKFFTLDNYRSLQLESISTNNRLTDLGIEPRALERIMRPLLKVHR